MVSGLVTSPCDHCRIFSGDASEIRIASKSGASCVFSCWNRNTLFSPLIAAADNTDNKSIFSVLSVAKTALRLYGAGDDRFSNAILRGAVFRCLLVDQLNVETKRLQLAHEHVERLRQTWIEVRFTFHDRLIDLRSPGNVVRLRGQEFLKNVRRAISFERPHLHLSETLSAKLRLTAEWLLRDQAVWSNRARVNLFVDQVRQLQHVDVSDRHFLLERIATQTVVKHCLTRLADDLGQAQIASALAGQLQLLLDLVFGSTIEHGCREVHAENARRPAQVRLENLTDVHARRHAQRIQNDLDRRSIRQVRHVFFRKDACDDALVSVTTGHLVAD